MTIKESTKTEITEVGSISEWLDLKCREKHLSLRQAADRSGLSHSTLASIKNGSRPTATTLSKLATAFGGDGPSQKAALEDKLLTLCGYRSSPEVKQSEPLARLVDKLSRLSDEQLIIMENIVDFCATLGDQPWVQKNR